VRSAVSYSAILCIVATVVMAAPLASPRFGLLDDGVTIAVSRDLLRSLQEGRYGSLLTLETDRGRLRPLSFLYYAAQYAAWDASPVAFFVIQWLSLIVTSLLILGIATTATGNQLVGLLSGVAYILSGPVIESYYTLSKGEPPLVLWLALSVLFLTASVKAIGCSRRRVTCLFGASLPSLAFAYFTKETAHAMVLVSGLWMAAAIFHERRRLARPISRLAAAYFAANLAVAAGYWGMRVLSRTSTVATGSNSAQYVLAPSAMLDSLSRHLIWYVRDFPFLVPLLVFVAAVYLASRKADLGREWNVVLGCVIWIAGWTAIMLPWATTLEYYLLPAALGTAILTGVGLSAVVQQLRGGSAAAKAGSGVVLVLVLCLGLITLANGATNGRIQVTVDLANSRLIDYLAQTVPQDGSVLVYSHGPSEYVFEMGLHLALLKGRGDITIGYLGDSDLADSSEAFIVIPFVKNQPLPSVRLGVWEGDVAGDRPELLKSLGGSWKLAWRSVGQVSLFIVSLERPICQALLDIEGDGQGVGWCRFGRPSIDTRVFEYGWEVYKI
jgi:hypothetical protein